jgi:hypothetical protein
LIESNLSNFHSKEEMEKTKNWLVLIKLGSNQCRERWIYPQSFQSSRENVRGSQRKWGLYIYMIIQHMTLTFMHEYDVRFKSSGQEYCWNIDIDKSTLLDC